MNNLNKALIYQVFLPKLQNNAFVRMSLRFKNPPPTNNITNLPFLDILNLLLANDVDIKENQIINAEPICSSIGTYVFPPSVSGKHSFKFLFEENLKDYETIYPEQRVTNTGATAQEYNEPSLNWRHIVNGETNQTSESSRFTDYDRIKHLGYQAIINDQSLLIDIITIYWIRKLKLDFWLYYTKQELVDNYWLNLHRIESENIVFYDNIPRKYWNKII